MLYNVHELENPDVIYIEIIIIIEYKLYEAKFECHMFYNSPNS
jgi:hypothetical protein